VPLIRQGRTHTRLPRLRAIALAAVLAVAVVASVGAPPASAKVPRGFFGMSAWNYPSTFDLQRMGNARVGTFRVNFFWPDIEPGKGRFTWSRYDALFTNSARVGIRLLPTIWGSPSWATQGTAYPPTSHSARTAFATFIRAALQRYGNDGSFWRSHPTVPKLPPAGWEVWNEPSHPKFWAPKRNAAGYVKLLRLAAQVIRKNDPQTQVVLGGIPNVYGALAIPFIKNLYRQKGFRSAFDVMNIHPYSTSAQALEDAVRAVRQVMSDNHDDAKPLWITEIGWASSGSANSPKNSLIRNKQGQAKELRTSYQRMIDLRKELNIGMVVWFSWRDRPLNEGEEDWWGPHTGLFGVHNQAKPAWGEYVKLSGGTP
jgi:Glycosyl hydrolase catalytic core